MIYYVMFLHFLADFVCQTSYTAEKKATSWITLLFHVALYTLVLGLGGTFLQLQTSTLLTFCFVNGLLHLGVDSVTAPLSKKFKDKGDTQKFFWVLGFDQFLHSCCLIWTTSFLN